MGDEAAACCTPSRQQEGGGVADSRTSSSLQRVNGVVPARHEATAEVSRFVELPGGQLVIGDDGALSYPGDGEHTVEVEVASFAISRTCVSNNEFAEFVEATGYLSEAERFGWSFVFGPLLPEDFPETAGVIGAEWWRQVYGATWRNPEGSGSSIETRADHPVVHVSYHDATAYAAWSGSRLCSEAEWEYAARGGTTTTWPWGNELEPGGEHQMNVFQGAFPHSNSGADGWLSTCPVDAFVPNKFGVWNMIGNVWEWTSDSYVPSQRLVPANRAGLGLLKGGSFLCHASYCHRYRPAARMGSTPDSSASNIGFRIAR
jgi:formylglycine-generating enzyme